jgi:hypothetical protein
MLRLREETRFLRGARLFWRSETGFLAEIYYYVEVEGRNPVSQRRASLLAIRNRVSRRDLLLCRG